MTALLLVVFHLPGFGQQHAPGKTQLEDYNPVWTTQSENAAASMPCGGGDVGLNVWVEKGDLLFYLSRSGTFDENNSLLKLGRIRIRLMPNPFEGKTFRQELVLRDGYIKISGAKGGLRATVKILADVFHPSVQTRISSSTAIHATITYESWRTADRVLQGKENNQNSWKWAPQGIVKTRADHISFRSGAILFYHRNPSLTVFDAAVQQQGLESVKRKLYNPLKQLTFGGLIRGRNLQPAGITRGTYLNTPYTRWQMKSIKAARQFRFDITLHTAQNVPVKTWQEHLIESSQLNLRHAEQNAGKSKQWWNHFWKRSYILIDQPTDSPEWKAAKNYQLFRYLLGCNAFGSSPTKFNGGLFTTDPVLVDSSLAFTPDFRNWGGGTHTAQNQRLVYWPMLKSGDAEMMKPQFEYYLKALRNAELRTRVYWHHGGASFTEQLENFGLPNPAEYGWKRPQGYDAGMEYNRWLEYEWDTSLEFCQMILESRKYAGTDIKRYLPLIGSCLTFFKEHYSWLARQRGEPALDADDHLRLFPGSGGETYKLTDNSSSTIAALKTVLGSLLELPPSLLPPARKKRWQAMLYSIPPLSYRSFNGLTTLSPAKSWVRINNTESTQLNPVFPWGLFGVGKAGLDIAVNTYLYDADALKFRSATGWKQDNIFAARLGLTAEAARLSLLKMKDSGRRFSAFWGPGFDWVPDHNQGGSGMIGMQEMLMQTNGRQILLFPAWPAAWDTHFKLHAPFQTTVEGVLRKGRIESLVVIPARRQADIVLMLK